MAYKYSKGSQVIGDLKAADDAERNTLIDFGEDQIEFQTSGSTRLKVDNNGIEVTGSLITTGDITVAGNVFDVNNKSVIKQIDHGACLINEANASERFLPDDIFHDYNGSNLYTTNAPPFSGSVDKLIVRGVNSSDLSDLGDLTAKVRIAGEGTDGYDVDTDIHCSNIESVTVSSASLGANKNCVFEFTGSNFTPQDIYAVTLTPTNNWTTNGDKYINFTIVTSYIID